MNLPAPPLPELLLYSRDGCCLCEGLEERLRALVPPPPLQVVNVDHDPELQARYGLEVPLLAVLRQGCWRRPPRAAEVGRLRRALAAVQAARPGDCVVIAGKGHENYQIIDAQRLYFSDEEQVLEALAGRAPS